MFHVYGLEIDKEDRQRLLGQHFSLQKMHTNRNLDSKNF